MAAFTQKVTHRLSIIFHMGISVVPEMQLWIELMFSVLCTGSDAQDLEIHWDWCWALAKKLINVFNITQPWVTSLNVCIPCILSHSGITDLKIPPRLILENNHAAHASSCPSNWGMVNNGSKNEKTYSLLQKAVSKPQTQPTCISLHLLRR